MRKKTSVTQHPKFLLSSHSSWHVYQTASYRIGSDLLFCLPILIDIIAAFCLCASKQIIETVELDLAGLCWPFLPILPEGKTVSLGLNIAKVMLTCLHSLLYLNEQIMFCCFLSLTSIPICISCKA